MITIIIYSGELQGCGVSFAAFERIYYTIKSIGYVNI